MALTSRLNQYQGINAHFQSFVQTEPDAWASFHAMYMIDLQAAIDGVLPQQYEVLLGRSLQLHDARPAPRQPSAQTIPHRRIDPAATVATPIEVLPLAESLEHQEDMPMSAILIQPINSSGGPALPVTRIELISPTTKTELGAPLYLSKRDLLLDAGTVLIELDFLHKNDAPVRGVPGYASGDRSSYAYNITVSIPQPSVDEGHLLRYGFNADELLLPIRVPLADNDEIRINFGAVYNYAFHSAGNHWQQANYLREPYEFDFYHPDDQYRIWARMLAVCQAVRESGNEIPQVPLPPLFDDSGLIWLSKNAWLQSTLLINDQTLHHGWLILTENANDANRLDVLVLGKAISSKLEHAPSRLVSGDPRQVKDYFDRLKATFERGGFPAFLDAIRNRS